MTQKLQNKIILITGASRGIGRAVALAAAKAGADLIITGRTVGALEELDDEIEGVEFVKLDVDQHPQIAGQNQVMGVPTVVILKDGEVKDRFVGVQPKEVIKEKITSLG